MFASPQSELYQPLTTFRLCFLFALLPLFLGALAATYRLCQRQAKPLHLFAQRLALTDEHSSEVRPDDGHQDLALIATAFNRLLIEFRRQRERTENGANRC